MIVLHIANRVIHAADRTWIAHGTLDSLFVWYVAAVDTPEPDLMQGDRILASRTGLDDIGFGGRKDFNLLTYKGMQGAQYKGVLGRR